MEKTSAILGTLVCVCVFERQGGIGDGVGARGDADTNEKGEALELEGQSLSIGTQLLFCANWLVTNPL